MVAIETHCDIAVSCRASGLIEMDHSPQRPCNYKVFDSPTAEVPCDLENSKGYYCSEYENWTVNKFVYLSIGIA